MNAALQSPACTRSTTCGLVPPFCHRPIRTIWKGDREARCAVANRRRGDTHAGSIPAPSAIRDTSMAGKPPVQRGRSRKEVRFLHHGLEGTAERRQTGVEYRGRVTPRRSIRLPSANLCAPHTPEWSNLVKAPGSDPGDFAGSIPASGTKRIREATSITGVAVSR